MTSPSWSPEDYLTFADPRARPFGDLIARVMNVDPAVVIDLGCGPGNMTRTLLDRWPGVQVIGIDADAAMIIAAQRLAADVGDDRLSFATGEIETWSPDGAVDVIVSNAALHWVPTHVDLLPRWLDALRPGGTLAFQVPRPADERPAAALHAVTSAPRWSGRFDGVATPGALSSGPTWVRSAAEYADLLGRLGCSVDAWETTYLHVLPGDDPVLAWFAGSGLRPFIDRLDETDTSAFRAEMAAAFREIYPRQPYGTLLPFRRAFVVAQR
jgi:trans-aconitate 2-methyltransferase